MLRAILIFRLASARVPVPGDPTYMTFLFLFSPFPIISCKSLRIPGFTAASPQSFFVLFGRSLSRKFLFLGAMDTFAFSFGHPFAFLFGFFVQPSVCLFVWQLISVRRAEFARCRSHVIERKHSLSVAKVSLSCERKKARIRVNR